MDNFTVWVLNELEARDWRPADLARGAGLSNGALSNILNGHRKPGPEILTNIAKALDVPPETVFRKAGLLPPLPFAENDPTLKEIHEYARQLTPEERRRLARIARLYFREQQERYNTDDGEDKPTNQNDPLLAT